MLNDGRRNHVSDVVIARTRQTLKSHTHNFPIFEDRASAISRIDRSINLPCEKIRPTVEVICMLHSRDNPFGQG